jgi:hypothetical protein
MQVPGVPPKLPSTSQNGKSGSMHVPSPQNAGLRDVQLMQLRITNAARLLMALLSADTMLFMHRFIDRSARRLLRSASV